MSSQNKVITKPSVFSSMQVAFVSLLNLKIFLRLLLPLVLAFLILVAIMILTWTSQKFAIENFFSSQKFVRIIFEYIGGLLHLELQSILGFISFLIIVFFNLVLLYVLTLALTSILLVPLLIPFFKNQYYPELEKKSGLSFFFSIYEGVKALVIYLLLLIVLLPLFLMPGLPLLIPLVLNALLARRVYVVDVLQDYADFNEFNFIKKNDSREFLQLGFLSSLLFYVPILNFLAPQISAMAYIHFVLGKLQELRTKA